MRILQIAHGLYPYHHAGVETYTYQLSLELLKRGHEVTVAVPIPAEQAAKRSSEVPVFFLPFPTDPNAYDATAKDLSRSWSALRKFIKMYRPDIIHVQHLMRIGSGMLEKLHSLGIPFILSLGDFWYLCRAINLMCRGSLHLCARHCTPGPLRRLPREYWSVRRRRTRCVSLLNRISAPLVTPSQKAAAIYREHGVKAERLIVQGRGVLDLRSHEAQFRPSAGPSIRFAYMGTLTPIKGVEILIRAFRKLPFDATLDIYGDGPSYNDFKELQALACGSSVRFHGAYDHRDLSRLYSKIDVVVVPSVCEEVFGRVLDEALSAGKIVIASATGGMEERIIHGVNGFLVPPRDADALAAQMSFVAKNYSRVKEELKYDLVLRPLRRDVEDNGRLYDWTIRNWRGLSKGDVTPIEWEFERPAERLSEYLKVHKSVVVQKLKRTWLGDMGTLTGNDEDHGLYQQTVAHMSPESAELRKVVATLLAKYKARSLLLMDGVSVSDAVYFSRLGVRTIFCDSNEWVRNFSRFSAACEGTDLEYLSKPPPGTKVDAAYGACDTVDSESIADRISGVSTRLSPGGRMIFAVRIGTDMRRRDAIQELLKEYEESGFDREELLVTSAYKLFIYRENSSPRLLEENHYAFDADKSPAWNSSKRSSES